ncbi:unnamed protein product [Brachionus calyciflorus]|uniref:SWIM-type domain-containing protein n=1 Tax=Brachionus calyciflorus TaxID=104777 RepID=A0A814K5W1_9BILA|nr:unnamed protein product [Brachionus calyciflorus]
MIKILEFIASRDDSIFSRFQDFDQITDSFCFKITGWSKNDFIKFSEFIKSIKNSKKRSKFQLIALYRYWLRKGSDQSTSAHLFSKTTTQRQISRYLEQIRILVNLKGYICSCKSGKRLVGCCTHVANKAKEIWINQIMVLAHKVTNGVLSIFGSEYSRFVKHLAEFQKHDLLQICNENCIYNMNLIIRENSENIFFKKIGNTVNLHSCYVSKCSACKSEVSVFIRLKSPTNFLLIQSADAYIFVVELPKTISIQNKLFNFICTTFYVGRHFIGVFDIDNKLYEVDDLDQSVRLFDSRFDNYPTTVSLFYEKEKKIIF